MKKKRTIVVLFTCYRDLFSSLLYHITNQGYTHASVSLEEGSDFYYGFNVRGFCREYPDHYERRMRDKRAALHLEVSEEDYQRIRNRIMEMEANPEVYHYTRLGIFFCLLHIAWRKEGRYFCSQFVSELLMMAGEIPLKKQPSLYLPKQLERELSGLPCVKRIELRPCDKDRS